MRYVPKSKRTRETKPRVIKNKSLALKQIEQTQPISKDGKINMRKKNTSDKKFSQNNRKFAEHFAAGGFGIITK